MKTYQVGHGGGGLIGGVNKQISLFLSLVFYFNTKMNLVMQKPCSSFFNFLLKVSSFFKS